MASKVSGVIEKIQTGGSNGTTYAIASTAYGYCNTAANVAAKTVEMTGFKLEEGVTIHIQFQYGNIAPSPTLNVQETGAKSIIYGIHSSDVNGNIYGWDAGAILTLTYDGTNWLSINSAYSASTGHILAGNIKPTISKIYTSTTFYGSDNSTANCSFFFMSIIPESWTKPWQVRFRIRSFCPAYTNGDSITWSTINGRADAIIYANWNEHYESGHQYIVMRILKAAGFNAGLGHALGINIVDSWNRTNSAYYRTFELDYYDCENCTVNILDNPVKWTNWTNNSDTYYNGFTNYDAVNRGLRESSDDNDTGTLQMHNGYFINGSTLRIPHYTLFGYDRQGRGQAISLYSSDYTGGTTSINTARVYNTSGIDYTRGIFYNSGENYDKNAIVTVSPMIGAYARDFRYTDNCIANANVTTLGLVREKPVYFRGTIESDGLFYLAPLEVTYSNATYKRAWTQDIPSSVDGYVYWFIGYPYYNGSYSGSLYQINLYVENKLYWFYDGKFQEYAPASVDAKGNIIDSTYVKKSGDTMTGDLTLYAASGNSPSLIFNRNGSLTDWRIIDTSGKLSFQSATDASTWTERAYFKDNSGNLVVNSIEGNGSALTSLNGSNISSGTVADARIANTIARLASPAFSGTPTAPTATNGTSTTQIATTEFVNNTLQYVNAMQFKGTLGTGGTITTLPATHNAGDTYRVITAETWAGKYCEEGTLIICVKDGTVAENTDWTSVETNEDGAVIGPSSSTGNNIVTFNGNTGRIIQDSGKSLTTTAPSSSSADTTIPTSKAVWSTVSSAINALDVSAVGGGTGEYISKISETDGKISATKSTTTSTFTITGGTTAGPTIKISINGVDSTNTPAIPSASGTASGIVTTDTQAFAGAKTFNTNVTVKGDIIFPQANKLDWNDGTYRQRLVVTDDSTANTAVFTFQQSSNSGSAYTNLFTILDNKSVATERYNYTVNDVIKAYAQYNSTDDSIDFIFA